MGFAQAMVSAMKSNSRRQKRTQFDKNNIYLSGNETQIKPVFKKSNKELLLKIKNRTQKNAAIYRKKLIGYTCLVSVIIVTTFIYLIKIYL